MFEDYIDYTELSINAQRLFTCIEHFLFNNNVNEIKVSKQNLMFTLNMSRSAVKTALKELKEKGYIIPKNSNSSTIRIGEQYEFRMGSRNYSQ